MKITITPIVSDISITSAQTVVNAQVGLSTSVLSNYVPLDNTGKVPSSLLPSYIDDVLEYTNLANFPAIGESGIIYIALDTFKTYRWTGSAYIWITSGDYVDLTQAQTVEGSKTWSDKANFSSQIESTLASGTPPFVVSSPTVVANLNVSLLEGNSASAFATAAQGSTADTALQNIVEDTSPELGGNLALNSYGMTEAFSAASGIQSSTKVVTVNQSGTAGYDADLVDVTETAVGSGAKYLIRRMVGAAAKFFIDNAGNGYFAGKVGIATENPSQPLHVIGNSRIEGRMRANNLTIGTDTIQGNSADYLATFVLGSDGATIAGGGLQITTNTARGAGKAMLGLVNFRLKTGAANKTTFYVEATYDTSVPNTQQAAGNFVNKNNILTPNLTLINQNIYNYNFATNNTSGLLINTQAYNYAQGSGVGSPSRYHDVYGFYSRGQLATEYSYLTNVVDFFAAPYRGLNTANAGITTRTGLLIDFYSGEGETHITNPRGVWQLGGQVLNHFAGNVGIGTESPNANAILDVTSTTKAFMPPRMTTTQKNAIASPTAGMVVYDATLAKLCVYTTAWETITST